MLPGQLVPKGLAHPVRILGEWTIAEGNDDGWPDIEM